VAELAPALFSLPWHWTDQAGQAPALQNALPSLFHTSSPRKRSRLPKGISFRSPEIENAVTTGGAVAVQSRDNAACIRDPISTSRSVFSGQSLFRALADAGHGSATFGQTYARRAEIRSSGSSPVALRVHPSQLSHRRMFDVTCRSFTPGRPSTRRAHIFFAHGYTIHRDAAFTIRVLDNLATVEFNVVFTSHEGGSGRAFRNASIAHDGFDAAVISSGSMSRR